jgi:hypothetical protein
MNKKRGPKSFLCLKDDGTAERQDNQEVPERDNQEVPERDNQEVPERDNQEVPERDNQEVPERDNQEVVPYWATSAYKYEKSRQAYAAKKAQGLCPRCGKRPPFDGRSRCVMCATRMRSAHRRYTHRQQAARRQGLKK